VGLNGRINRAAFQTRARKRHRGQFSFENLKTELLGGAHFRHLRFWCCVNPAKLNQKFLDVILKSSGPGAGANFPRHSGGGGGNSGSFRIIAF
jgi:hypothetical protein